MPTINFRFLPRVVPLKIHCGHCHLLLQLPPGPSPSPAPWLYSVIRQNHLTCSKFIIVSQSIFWTLSRHYSPIFTMKLRVPKFFPTHTGLVFCQPCFILGHRVLHSPSQLKPSFQVLPIHTFTLKIKAVNFSGEINTLTQPAPCTMQHFLSLSWQATCL